MGAIGASTGDGIVQTIEQIHSYLHDDDSPVVDMEDGMRLNGLVLKHVTRHAGSSLTSTTWYLMYDIATHRRQIDLWTQYTSGIQAKGTALAIMYQAFVWWELTNQPPPTKI